MKPLTIQSYHSKHEGGTKFYSVWTIFGRKKAVTVTQWGPNNAYVRGSAQGGQHKIEAFSNFQQSANAGNGAIAAKRRRGYNAFVKDWSSEHKTTNELDDEVIRLFGQSEGFRIINALDEPTDAMAAQDAARVAPAFTKELDRGDVWGSW